MIFLLAFALVLSSKAGDKERWREALGSDDFAEREAATNEVWSGGSANLEFLQDLLVDDDPELRARALMMVRKVKLGVTPESPERVRRLVEQYFTAKGKTRILVIEDLLAAKEYEFLLRLPGFEKDEEVIEKLEGVITQILPGVVRDHLNEGNVKEALEDLARSGQFAHLVQYAHLLQVTGQLDAEIKRLSESGRPEDQARYLACLRVKGDAELLLREAQRLSDEDAGLVAALSLGDHLSFLKSALEEGNPTLPNRSYLQWSIAQHEGDQAAQKMSFDRLVHLSGKRSERQAAQMSLLRMGYGELVLEGLLPGEFDEKVTYLLSHDRYEEAQEAMGLVLGGGFESWLEEISAKARVEIEKTGESPELSRLAHAVKFLEERGLLEEAGELCSQLFNLLSLSDHLSFEDFVSGMYYSAPVSVFRVIADELSEDDEALEVFLELLPIRAPGECLWLFRLLAEIYPQMEFQERLLLTMSFSSRELFVQKEVFREARNRVFGFLKGDENEVNQLKNLTNLLVDRNREEDLLMVTEALAQAGMPNHFLEAILAMDAGRIEESAEAFSKMEIGSELVSVGFLYQKGLVFKNAGRVGGAEMMRRAMLLSDGSAASLRGFAMEHLRHGEILEAFELMRRALLRTEGSVGAAQFGVRNAIIEELAKEAGALGYWSQALAYREAAALSHIYVTGSVGYGIYSMRLRFQILVARGAVAMNGGDFLGAEKAFRRAHEILPMDGYLANDFFPLLRSLGLDELHDELFLETIERCRGNVIRYPQDDNAYNNFAWMASRANRCLEEAEGYLKVALFLNSESAEYLDTMAEIFFARRNRAEAVAWSKRSLSNAALGTPETRWELQFQNQRFRLGDFPLR